SAATEPVTIELDPLSSEESDRLIQNLLGPSAISKGYRARVADAAEGNPLFVEEMLGMLIDDERLRREEGMWVATDEDVSVPTPPSIQSLLAARIERLPQAEREILQRASVAGKVFWWGAVADLSPSDDRSGVGSRLQTLVRRGMIRPDLSEFAGQDAFRFKHILIRDAAYESVPRELRAGLHERLANWIERTAGERGDEYEEILGYHLEQACRQRLASAGERDRELAARASSYLASAGDRALDRGDARAAVNLLSRASKLSAAERPEDLAVRLSLGRALHYSGEFRQALGVLAELAKQAIAAGDQRLEWRARIQQQQIIVATTTDVSFEEIRTTADRAIEIFTELDDDLGLFWSWELMAWMHFNAGRAHEAQKAASKATSYAPSPAELADGLLDGLTYAVFGPMPVEEALRLCGDVRGHVEGDPAREASLLQLEAILEAMRGNIEKARAGISRARSTWQELGHVTALASFTESASDVEWYAGDVIGAERERRSGYEAWRKMRVVGYQSTQAALLAELLVELGRDDEALSLTRESEKLAADYDITAQVPWRGARARVLARRGEVEEAVRLAREAEAMAERTDWLKLQGDTQIDLADVLRLAGRSEEATHAALKAAELYEQKGDIVATARAGAVLVGLKHK
ncbi:MAG TPA: hypothetical protein VFT03_03995, partial [Rubrobacteraceae bacterium]|nr:hypothetical protein [Rubrobacteraceae bacterium]